MTTKKPYRVGERLDAHTANDYHTANERASFRAGYSDGFHGYDMWAGQDKDWYPNAYSAGYWDGVADSNNSAED